MRRLFFFLPLILVAVLAAPPHFAALAGRPRPPATIPPQPIPPGGIAITVRIEPNTPVKGETQVPRYFSLEQNYPNPFNASTIIKYSCARDAYVALSVYNILGEQVATLVSRQETAGLHAIWWDGRDNQGKPLSSGIYLYRMVAGPFVQTKKLLILK